MKRLEGILSKWRGLKGPVRPRFVVFGCGTVLELASLSSSSLGVARQECRVGTTTDSNIQMRSRHRAKRSYTANSFLIPLDLKRDPFPFSAYLHPVRSLPLDPLLRHSPHEFLR